MQEVKSDRQSGGITANEVRIQGDFKIPSKANPKTKTWKKIVAAVVTVLTIGGGAAAVLNYFGITLNNMDQANPTKHAGSNKQSGGITANEVNINMSTNEYDKFHIDVSPIIPYRNLYRRTIKVRNNTKYPQNSVHISINGTEEILYSGTPMLEGGGMIMVNYIKNEEKSYETEIGTIPAQKYVVIELASPKPFEVDVKIY
ncbi:MAG: hypothetical protein Q7S48_00385 [bacterium]|nr:hypothetical protein [bacterium]